MAVTLLTTAKGSGAGPDSGHQFHVEIQLGYDGKTDTGYKMYRRCLVYVDKNTSGSTISSNLTVSWSSTKYSLGNTTGLKADSGWVYLGEYAYGETVSYSANCYYTSGSGKTYKSETTAKYTIPFPEYTISYDGNGGKNVPEEQTKTYGTDIVLADTIPEYKGHKFLGWGTSADAEDVAYLPGDTYTNNESIVLYAIWKKTSGMAIREKGLMKKGRPFLDGKYGTPWIKVSGIWRKGE